MSSFPKDFLWGASTSAYQIEGGITNNWSIWEKETAKERSKNIGGYPWGTMPDPLKKIAENPEYRVSGLACDSFHRYSEDISILKELGLNAYRFSVEWSRIFPEKGEPSEEGLEYYRSLIRDLKRENIEPVLTCWHWTLPLWITKEGGLMSKHIEEYFERYFEVLAREFGKDIKYWITLNEPDVVAYTSYCSGEWPPQEKSFLKYLYLYYSRLVKIHRLGYRVIKSSNPAAMVGVAKQNSSFEPYQNTLENRLAVKVSKFFANELYLDRVKNKLDFIGLNYYFHNKVGVKGLKNDNDKLSDAGWWMRPDCLYYALVDLKKYNLPIIITENGVADYKDQYRKWWLDETFEAMKKALYHGVDLRGYFHWSLLDNFEWAQGYYPKFGLASVDRKTLHREIRESGFHYHDLVRKYS
jgi:beta-glucosidase